MGLRDCEITFDNVYKTYSPGQVVNGRVKITLDSDKRIRGIFIRFKGEANTVWRETIQERKKRHRSVHYKAHENYFNIKYSLIGSSTGEMILPSGTHTYGFTCSLPPSLPSSFEGEFGHIRYTVKVTLDRPWKFDQDTKTAFTVISNVDLNQNLLLKQPVQREMSKTFCCMCCKSGPLSMVVNVPMTGFVSGQKIPIHIMVDNGSRVDIERINFNLRKIATFYSHTPRHKTRQKKHVIATVSVGAVNAGCTNSLTGYICIPSLPPSNLVNCGIIDLDYEIKVEVEASGTHSGLNTKIPIILGTIPFDYYQEASAPPPIFQLPPNLPPAYMPPSTSEKTPVVGLSPRPVEYRSQYSVPPPTYEESQFGTKSIQDESDSTQTRYSNGASSYAPRYPVYTFPPTAPPLN